MRSSLKQRPRRRKRPARWTKPGWILVFLIVVGGSSIDWFYSRISTTHEHSSSDRIVTIPTGSSAREISARLRQEGIVEDTWTARTWLLLASLFESFKAGDYRFTSPISVRQVAKKLAAGDIYLQRVTFPEGFNRFDIARLIGGLAIPGTAQALQLTLRRDLVADLDPEADSLEGYLFPDTYEYSTTTTAEQLVTKMVRRFRQIYSPEFQQHTRETGWTVRQVVTLASMIEREAQHPDERALVSSVYHNRLKISMKLDCDPTVIYGSMLAGRWTGRITRFDLIRKTRYNTYLFAGLPPGPIACPGRGSIEAALFPADTKYKFFVVDGDRADGSHRFASTASEHGANVALYRQYERERTRR